MKTNREYNVDARVKNDNFVISFIQYYKKKPLIYRVAIVQYLRDICNEQIRKTMPPGSGYPSVLQTPNFCEHCGTTIKKK